MKKFLTLLAVFLVFGFSHPFYLGVCDLKYNAKEQALQGSVKLFTGDLENALAKLNGKKTDLLNIKDSVATGKLLENYLIKHLSFAVNGEKKTYRLIGFEKEQEAIWLYIEVVHCPLPKKVVITNTLLYDYLKEQMNIVHLEVGNEKKSLKVVNPDKEMVFDF